MRPCMDLPGSSACKVALSEPTFAPAFVCARSGLQRMPRLDVLPLGAHLDQLFATGVVDDERGQRAAEDAAGVDPKRVPWGW